MAVEQKEHANASGPVGQCGLLQGPSSCPPRESGWIEPELSESSRAFLRHLEGLQLLSGTSIKRFLQDGKHNFPTARDLGEALVRADLLTTYQLDRVMAGTTQGLVLGNYRVLDRLGSGGMGVVFLAEHTIMKRRVAIKVMPVDRDCPVEHLERFYTEMRVHAALQHPNIVMAFDSGRLTSTDPSQPSFLYLVMELVDGQDLERYVHEHGPQPIGKACEWICQAACGLQEAHNRHLVHRDVKPSNLLLTRDGRIKLVDFGLVRQYLTHITDPDTLLGTLDFMAPEQSYDPTSVGSQADIYALGATLFFLLTHQSPHAPSDSINEALQKLQKQPPRRLRSLRPDVPQALDDFVNRLLDRVPTARPAMALAVKKHLEPFTSIA
jgi:serine/threonine protein kinase